jgi:hypothetical protein
MSYAPVTPEPFTKRKKNERFCRWCFRLFTPKTYPFFCSVRCQRVHTRNYRGRTTAEVIASRANKLLASKTRFSKAQWVALARIVFDPGPSQPCSVCGWSLGTQAHHANPLGRQYDAGATVPDQTFVWLCPNHHFAVHHEAPK